MDETVKVRSLRVNGNVAAETFIKTDSCEITVLELSNEERPIVHSIGFEQPFVESTAYEDSKVERETTISLADVEFVVIQDSRYRKHRVLKRHPDEEYPRERLTDDRPTGKYENTR